ncbi:GNAT family N-acetyltransferase [Thalassotalea montiporae]
MEVKLISVRDAQAISEYYANNHLHLGKWEPLRLDGYHAISAWKSRLVTMEKEQREGRTAFFVSYSPETSKIIATCVLSNIVRGPFQACNMGYSIAREFEGMGLMKALCEYVIAYAFDELGLNRVMANYMPNNTRSEKLLSGLGFEIEGKAKNYLKINGRWEDHILTSLLNPSNIG